MRVDIATEPGSPDKPNEDYAATGPNIVVVLDGQTARTGTGCIHGVAWYSARVAEAIIENAALGPTKALSAAITRTADLHRDTCDLSHPGTPSAAVAVVQLDGDTLRYLVLGDVTVVLDSGTDVRVISDHRVSQTALAERAIADAMPADSPEKPAALVRMKHAELAARNTPGGFWVAATEPTASEHALTGEFAIAEVQRVAVLSDGATRAVEAFELYGWTELLDILNTSGPGELIKQVRAAEASDQTATRWPRNKLSDDATAVYCVVGFQSLRA
ncbi:hypothetical protein AB0M43_37915 [Longispora sp. NPDC051575]|uniref:hypothetical protein n=1 Tax=Longispora sp. NPDC051575 TaxID=3154943 RepID=UPI0034470496